MATLANAVVRLGAKVAPYFIAIPMAIFGAQHFVYLQFVADFVPAWIPWRTFWAGFTGVALMAAALGIVLNIWRRWAAALLGTMILLWVVMLHTSRIAGKPTDFGEWRGIFQALAMSGCAFVLAGSSKRIPGENYFATKLNALAEIGTGIAPYFIGGAMMALGIEHFICASTAVPQVPVWIPGSVVGNYASGAVLVLCGAGICHPATRGRAAAGLGCLIFLSMLCFHLPLALSSPGFESDWTKTFVLSGGAFLLARVWVLRENEIDPALSTANGSREVTRKVIEEVMRNR